MQFINTIEHAINENKLCFGRWWDWVFSVNGLFCTLSWKQFCEDCWDITTSILFISSWNLNVQRNYVNNKNKSGSAVFQKQKKDHRQKNIRFRKIREIVVLVFLLLIVTKSSKNADSNGQSYRMSTIHPCNKMCSILYWVMVCMVANMSQKSNDK